MRSHPLTAIQHVDITLNLEAESDGSQLSQAVVPVGSRASIRRFRRTSGDEGTAGIPADTAQQSEHRVRPRWSTFRRT